MGLHRAVALRGRKCEANDPERPRTAAFGTTFALLSVPWYGETTKVLAGFDHAKQRFRTAAAKEYPAGLSEGIVRSAFLSLQMRRRSNAPQTVQWQDFSSSDRKWVQSLIEQGSSFSTSTFLPDFDFCVVYN